MTSQSLRASTIAVLSAAVLSGCTGATNPSPELYRAQDAYQHAAASRASELAPDRLLTAKQTLDQANAATPGSDAEQHLSYLAARRARMAEVYADWVYDRQELASEHARVAALEAERRARAEQRLIEANGELARSQQNLAASSSALRQERSRVQTLKGQLDTAESERAAAEKKANDALASLEQVAKVKAEATETVITLSGAVLFVTGRSELLPIAREKLDRVASALADSGNDEHIVVEGFTDSRGSRTKNQALSLDRARAVRDYLVSKGVDPTRIEARGFGPDQPVATNSTPEGRADNRRVEIHVQKSQ